MTHAHSNSSRIGKYYNPASNAGLGSRKSEDDRFMNATNIVVRGKTVFINEKGKVKKMVGNRYVESR